MLNENLKKGESAKNHPKFVGPYTIVEIRGPLARLVHFYTGKIIRPYINVCKLRRVQDCRDELYNRVRPLRSASDTKDLTNNSDDPSKSVSVLAGIPSSSSRLMTGSIVPEPEQNPVSLAPDRSKLDL